MTDDDYYLETVTLSAHEWRGIQQLANALDEFEPLTKRGNLGPEIADRLVSNGLAETGPAPDRYAAIGMVAPGYRLTPFGWRVKERGRYARRQSRG